MEKVWIVAHDGYDEFWIHGIFSTEAKAIKYIETLDVHDRNSATIEAYMIDNPEWDE
jgi:hypothetical protein